MNKKLVENVKYFKQVCDKHNLQYEEVEKYTIPFNVVMYSVNVKDNAKMRAKVVINEFENKPLIYRLIQATLETLNDVRIK